MAWHDFSSLSTDHFNMAPDTTIRFFNFVPGSVAYGVPEKPTWEEVFFAQYSFVPRAPKTVYDQLPVDKRERDHCLVWMPPNDVARLKTVKIVGPTNASRIYDVQRSKWYVVSLEWDYLRQGNLNGAVGELVDNPVPDNLPPLV